MRTIPRRTTTGTTTGTAAAASPTVPAPARQLDPVVARALFAAWSGDPAVVVTSPPGAGKTRLVTHLARELSDRAGLDVAIAAQTRAQALDVANRAGVLGSDVALLGKGQSLRPAGLNTAVHYAPGGLHLHHRTRIVVATTARWAWTPTAQYRADVLLVDEAWQLTFADLGALGAVAAQIVMVGDPGQIAPVVTADAHRWEGWASGPQQPAPDALIAAHPDEITQLHLPHTWRLGPDTTALVQPAFYPDLPFSSMRPPRTLAVGGSPQPELLGVPVATTTTGRADPVIITTAVERVRTLLTDATLTTPDGEHRIRPEDVALVVPHVSQANAAAAHLTDVPGVLVGTVNQTQGLEREAVVVVHPLAGYRDTPGFATDPGRLCVALSRHRAHLSVITDPATATVLDRACAADPHDRAVAVQRDVLHGLSRPSARP